MFKYTSGDEVGPLQEWPFENPLGDYCILDGEPKASGRIDSGGPGHMTRSGIWHCTKGIFDCTEQGDELMTILSGRCQVTDKSSGVMFELSKGDSLFVCDGKRVTWDIIEDITKVFFGHKSDGY
jgi:uncharacterized cupin superfamily protein